MLLIRFLVGQNAFFRSYFLRGWEHLHSSCSVLPSNFLRFGLLLYQDFAMEVLGSILGSAVVETGRLLCGCIYSCVKNTIKFQSNLNALEKEMRDLIDLRNNVKQELESAEIDGKLPTTQVKEWLREVEEIELQVNSLQAGNTTNNENLCGYFLNWHKCLRYRLGRKVSQILKEVERLLKACSFPAGMVAVNYLATTIKHIPVPSIEDQTTVSAALAKTMKLLGDDGVRRIGIWGMGGVGKTTLVKNLNNKLKSTSLTWPFGMVIWATVSKQLDLKRVQTQIAERLSLPVTWEESQQGLAIRLYERLVKEKKFLLILDDVWETIDLDSLGVPQPEIHTGSKIILTSRSLEVCREMRTDAEVKVDVLNDEEAWKLFTKNAGKVASFEHIKPFAEAVVRECNGLPLAIIAVGTAMREKTKIELWKDALNELQRSEPFIKGIENKVYKPLKWSYDSLHGEKIKSCFLYCSLFPEDFSIKVSELIQYWLAEGLIGEQPIFEHSLNRGIAIVENLKDSCLLEDGIQEGTVKMHDVVRDVAIWIASSLEDGCKSIVRSEIGLSQISEVELLKSCKRISFMNNKIKILPDCVIQCPETSTLLLQGNRFLERVPESFLVGFQALRVLNMSGTRIQSLPLSLTQLGELRALVLQGCRSLEELPPLGGLRKLQVLDLCGTQIRELPKGMEELSNLRQLNLSITHHLKTIQAGVVSRLSGIEVLDMTPSAYKWGVKGEVEEGHTMFEELGSLTRLTVVRIWLGSLPYLSSKDLIWIKRLRRFKIIVSPYIVRDWFLSKYDERKVILSNFDLSKKQIGWLLINASHLVLTSCTELDWMFEYLVKNSGGFAGLKSLTVDKCHSFGPFRGCAARHDLLPNLEELFLNRNNNLVCVWALVAPLGLRFSRLRFIRVSRCPKLTHLIPHDLIPNLINLEEIKVSFCNQLNELFQYSSGHTVARDPVVPKPRHDLLPNLEELYLNCNNNLECVWPLVAPRGLRFSRLRVIRVSRCPKLTYLIPHDLIPNLINLEEIKVSFCNQLNELFQYSLGQTVARDPIVPKLRIIELENLPELTIICRQTESWQSLEQLEVINCNQLRKLPLTSRNANTTKEIRGEQQWWSELEWDDDDTKLSLLPYFKPVGPLTTFTDQELHELLVAQTVVYLSEQRTLL